MTDEFEQTVERIKQALLGEYRWHQHDRWSTDDDARRMAEEGASPWPHLQHVAEVAAHAALYGRDEQS